MNGSTKKSKRKLKNTWGQIKMKTQQSKIFAMQQSSSKREVYSSAGLSQEARKILNKQPNPTPKGDRKRTKNEAQIQQKEGNKKDYSRGGPGWLSR